MYLYYGLAGMKIRLCKPYYITTMQISQMVVGVGICVAGGYYISKGKSIVCTVVILRMKSACARGGHVQLWDYAPVVGGAL